VRLLTPFSLTVGVGLLAAGCADPAGLSSRTTARPTASVSGVRRVSYPNAQKYRDHGAHPATGRSGSAAISTRALVGRSGRTDVEVTTGSFDDVASATGTLASVQVKAFTPAGRLAFTSNHNALNGGGAASFAYTSLPRGTPLQLQAVVRGIDGTRSDVVTVVDAVHARPDLVAIRLAGPDRAVTGQPVNFEAFIAERQGDLGARASCVLYVDGAPVDRADGIWVDAGGTVACAMTHRFETVGAHALELRVVNVQPGDYDDSNNSVSSSIQIVAPNEFTAYSLYASDENDDTWYRYVSALPLPDGTSEWWDQTYTIKGRSQYASIGGIIHRSLAFPIHAEGEMATNGATINTFANDASGDYVDWMEAYCASDFAATGGGSVYICVYTGSYLAGYSTVQYDWWGADVRYHTDNYVSSWDPSGQLNSRYFAEDYSQEAPLATFGSDFTARVSVWGAGDDMPTTAEATAPLTPFSYDTPFADPACGPIPSTSWCDEGRFTASGMSGFVDYGSWPSP
jgi:hypothetical protein